MAKVTRGRPRASATTIGITTRHKYGRGLHSFAKCQASQSIGLWRLSA